MQSTKPRLLSGDTPSGKGKLHLGHWVGALENRISLQSQYESYFIIANVHAFTTASLSPEAIRQNTLQVALDYLSAGVDPQNSTIFIQSEIPAIAELTIFFSMLLSYSRVMRNPTLKDEIRDKGLGENYSFGFLLYPIGQVADILAFRPNIVPVGEDQVPHLEMAREVARRFNHIYCQVASTVSDEAQQENGGLFPIIQPKLSRVKRLVGLSGPNASGVLPKMSKFSDNAIYLSDTPEIIQKKVMCMYTDPKRLRVTDPGTIENNPLWIFHEAFNLDHAWMVQAMDRYKKGQISDVECKKKLIDVLINFTEPFRERRRLYEKDPAQLWEVLKKGTEKANEIAEETLKQVKEAMKQNFFERTLQVN